jgi:hypothetical protein
VALGPDDEAPISTGSAIVLNGEALSNKALNSTVTRVNASR